MRYSHILFCTLAYGSALSAEELEPISITTTVTNSPSVTNKPIGIESDTSTLLERFPGGAVHSNGQISGQTYYRGVFGPRMNVIIDNYKITSAGPNWMDPPLHYQPNTLVESFEVDRGLSSVSNGSTLGTTVRVQPKTSQFQDSKEFVFGSELETSVHSVDTGYNTGAITTFANDQHRFHITGSRDDGDDLRTGDGDIDNTAYERDSVGAGYGFKTGVHEFSFDGRYVSSKDIGTPSLPLDIDFFHNEIYNAKYTGELGGLGVTLDAYHTDIEHRMRNFSERTAPDFSSLPLPPFIGTDRREIDVASDDIGGKLSLSTSLHTGELSFGIDGHSSRHDATVLDPDVPPFFVTNFNNAGEDVIGIFSEWQGDIKSALVEFGVRVQRVYADADEIDAQPANLPAASMMGTPPAAVRALRERFNNSDRSHTDYNLDLVAKMAYPLNEEFTLTAGYARKTRSASYIERYIWIPLNVNAGLGDGNNFIGNPNLDPEWSNQFELGFDWQNPKAFFTPRIHYQRINNYIQGVAVEASPFNMPVIGVSGLANGDPTPLQFSNVEAEIYGFDAEWGYQINDAWSVGGTATYLRGKRLDVNDDLYHIAPPRTNIALTRNFGKGSATIEGVLVARQTKISDELTDDPTNPLNNNDSTPGYGLVNIYGDYTPTSLKGITLRAGVENLFDKQYTDHLNGFNRVVDNGEDLGERLSGPGINAFLTLNVTY